MSRITVKGAGGNVELSKPAVSEDDDSILWATFAKPLADGMYSVSWVTSSGDGHPVRGNFDFSVKAAR